MLQKIFSFFSVFIFLSTFFLPLFAQSGRTEIDEMYDHLWRKNQKKTFWQKELRKMKKDYATITKVEEMPFAKSEEKEALWRVFLAKYEKDNPFSWQDNDMKMHAREKIRHWQNNRGGGIQQTLLEQKASLQKMGSNPKEYTFSEIRAVIEDHWQLLEKISISSERVHQSFLKQIAFSWPANYPISNHFSPLPQKDLVQVLRSHQMKLLAYPANGDYYIEIAFTPEGWKYRKQSHPKKLEGYSKEAIVLHDSLFPQIIREISQNEKIYQPSDGTIYLLVFSPERLAEYFHWKQVLTCQKYGYLPEEV